MSELNHIKANMTTHLSIGPPIQSWNVVDLFEMYSTLVCYVYHNVFSILGKFTAYTVTTLFHTC